MYIYIYTCSVIDYYDYLIVTPFNCAKIGIFFEKIVWEQNKKQVNDEPFEHEKTFKKKNKT